jgi:hypothetical protein
MEKTQVVASCTAWFQQQGFTIDPAEMLDARWHVEGSARRGPEHWLVCAVGDCADEKQYLFDFDDCIDRLITTNARLGRDVRMGAALPFSSTENGRDLSYRRALKKYSNSIIFIDLDISLLLVRDDATVELVAPEGVNPFLRDLNRLIGRNRREM